MMNLDFLGKGLLRELAEEFADLIYDDGLVSIDELEAGVRLEPAVATRHRELGRRMLQDAKPAHARKSFTKALELEPGDPLSRLGLACALDAIGLTPMAIKELKFCLNARPEYCPAIVSMGYCLQKSGRAHEAIRAYEQALRLNPKLLRTREKLAPITLSACDKFPEINGQPGPFASLKVMTSSKKSVAPIEGIVSPMPGK